MSIKSRFQSFAARFLGTVAPKVDECCGLCPKGACHANDAQSAALVQLVDTGKLVSEPPKPKRSTNASRRAAAEQAARDRAAKGLKPVQPGLNRAQRRALNKLAGR